MKAGMAGLLSVWIATGAALAAANFWEEKAYTTWSETEVKKMLTDSPWAHKVSVLTPDLSLASRTGGLSGGVVGNGRGAGRAAGGGGVGGDGAGNIGGGTFMASPLRTELAVRWASALPVKRAVARGRLGGDGALPAEAQQLLAQDESSYRVAVVGLPLELTDAGGSLDELRAATILKPRNKAAIGAVDLLLMYEGDLVTIEFEFPKAAPITLEDKEVEFITKLGQSHIKKKFKLADMVFGDQLAL